MSQLSKVIMQRFTDAKTIINSQLQISAFLAANGIAVESNRQVCCPLHDDSTPSFSVNFATNEWKCFGCPDGGHYIDLWMKLTNKRTGSNYNIFTAIEQILKINPSICSMLGFNSIYQAYDEEFSLFRKKNSDDRKDDTLPSECNTSVFDFDEILRQPQNIQYICTDTIEKVMHKLKDADINKVVQFIADCELGMSDDKLISKYYHERVIVSDFIKDIDTELGEDITNTFWEALEDD